MRAIAFYLFAALALLAGCVPAGKLAQVCADRYPCRVDTVPVIETRIDSFIIPWHTVEFVDTTICPPADTFTMVVKEVVVDVPPRVITRHRIDTTLQVVYADSALVVSLRNQVRHYQNQAIKCAQDLARAKGARGAVWSWLLPLIGGLVAGMFFMRFILNGRSSRG